MKNLKVLAKRFELFPSSLNSISGKKFIRFEKISTKKNVVRSQFRYRLFVKFKPNWTETKIYLCFFQMWENIQKMSRFVLKNWKILLFANASFAAVSSDRFSFPFTDKFRVHAAEYVKKRLSTIKREENQIFLQGTTKHFESLVSNSSDRSNEESN